MLLMSIKLSSRISAVINLTLRTSEVLVMYTLGHFTFWLRPWLSLLAQTKH